MAQMISTKSFVVLVKIERPGIIVESVRAERTSCRPIGMLGENIIIEPDIVLRSRATP